MQKHKHELDIPGINRGGRKKIEFTDKDWKQLYAAVQIHCTAEECAALLGVSSDTLDRRFKEVGVNGFAEYYKNNCGAGKASLRRMQWKTAQSGNATMQIWLGKQMLNQRDKHEITGGEGGPLRVVSSEMTPKEAAEAYAATLNGEDGDA